MLKFLPLMLTLSLFTACSSHHKDKIVATHPVTDAEISNSVLTADTEEMNLSDLGRAKAKSSSVKAFANEMYNAHSTHSEQANAVIDKNQLMPKDTKASMEMKGSTETEIESLKMLNGAEFDKSFMAAQVKAHEDVLKDLKENLIPKAKNPELLSFLEKTQTTVEAHLSHAKSIQATL